MSHQRYYQSYLGLAIQFLIVAGLLTVAYSLYLLVHVTFFGALPGVEPDLYLQIQFGLISAIATAAGIFSKILYDTINRPPSPEPAVNSKRRLTRGLLTSVLLAPVVVATFLDEIILMQNAILAAVFAYQNGFFFQSLSQEKAQ
jgi:hypothetical protein